MKNFDVDMIPGKQGCSCSTISIAAQSMQAPNNDLYA